MQPISTKVVAWLLLSFSVAIVTFLFLGYRHLHQLKLPDGLSAAGAMLFGMTLGASWELLEFALDWFGNANLQKLADSHLVGLIEPEDIARCALYLASDESRMVTGQVIPVDSGVTIS